MQLIINKGITMRRIRNIQRVNAASVANGLKAAADPMRLLSVASYWAEFGEPIQLLDDPLGTFAADAKELMGLCEQHRIHFNASGEPTFPVWLLREFYPANP